MAFRNVHRRRSKDTRTASGAASVNKTPPSVSPAFFDDSFASPGLSVSTQSVAQRCLAQLANDEVKPATIRSSIYRQESKPTARLQTSGNGVRHCHSDEVAVSKQRLQRIHSLRAVGCLTPVRRASSSTADSRNSANDFVAGASPELAGTVVRKKFATEDDVSTVSASQNISRVSDTTSDNGPNHSFGKLSERALSTGHDPASLSGRAPTGRRCLLAVQSLLATCLRSSADVSANNGNKALEEKIWSYVSDHVKVVRNAAGGERGDGDANGEVFSATAASRQEVNTSVNSAELSMAEQPAKASFAVGVLRFCDLSTNEQAYAVEVLAHWEQLLLRLCEECSTENSQQERMVDAHSKFRCSPEERKYGASKRELSAQFCRTLLSPPPFFHCPTTARSQQTEDHPPRTDTNNTVNSSVNIDTLQGDEEDTLPPVLPPKMYDEVPETSAAITTASDQKPKQTDYSESKLLKDIRDLDNHGWYWGPLPRREAEQKLEGCPPGTFLVRDCSDRMHLYCMSVRSPSQVSHVLVKWRNGRYSLLDYPHIDDSFQTMPELVQRTITSQQGTLRFIGGVVHLRTPLSRFQRVQSLQHICRFVIRRRTPIILEKIDDLPISKFVKAFISEQNYY